MKLWHLAQRVDLVALIIVVLMLALQNIKLKRDLRVRATSHEHQCHEDPDFRGGTVSTVGHKLLVSDLPEKTWWTVECDVWTPFHEYTVKYKSCEECPLVHKWEPYFEAYHNEFKRFRGKEVVMLEVGVQSGGSILMWRWYFGDKFRYYGVDINPEARRFANSWATILIGDQADPQFWADVKQTVPKVDIMLDDGGHTMNQQMTTFYEFFDHVKAGGVYACEDLSTSYFAEFGGSPLQPGGPSGPPTMLGLTKQWVDWINAYFTHGNWDNWIADPYTLPENLNWQRGAKMFATSATSVHFYSQSVFVRKGQVHVPGNIKVGNSMMPYHATSTEWSGKKVDLDSMPPLQNP